MLSERHHLILFIASLPLPLLYDYAGQAELSFINGDNDEAIALLSQVTSRAPKLAEPYSILALIYESFNDHLRALQLYALAGTYTPFRDSLSIWMKVAELATQIGRDHVVVVSSYNDLEQCIFNSDYHHMNEQGSMIKQWPLLHDASSSLPPRSCSEGRY